MNNYYALTFSLAPFSEDAADLLAAFLADIGFESFTSESPSMTAYIKEDLFNINAVNEIINNFPFDCSVSFSKELIEGQDWNHEWEKNYFKPIVIEDRVVIHSSFHHNPPEAQYTILIDPKMAFGTGHHATTSMMVSHLLNIDLKGKYIIDMGTGTGILAILSIMLGAQKAIGIEIDRMAYENTLENGKLNNSTASFICGDASSLSELSEADIFLANINRNVIMSDLPLYANKLKKDGRLILSGFYPHDIPILMTVAEPLGFKIEKSVTLNDWASIILKR